MRHGPEPLSSRLAYHLLTLLLAAIALFLLIGGAKLAALGGSPYYALAGIAVAATAGLLFFRHGLATTVYTLFFIATLVWSFWEVGTDIWQLMPRLVGPAVFLIILWLPWTRRRYARPVEVRA